MIASFIMVCYTDEIIEVDYAEVVDHAEDEKRKLNNKRYQEGENNVVMTLCPVWEHFQGKISL